MIALQYHHKAAEGRLEPRRRAVSAARTARRPAAAGRSSRSRRLRVLIGLGTWQLERKAWKEGADRDAATQRLRRAPVALPPRDRLAAARRRQTTNSAASSFAAEFLRRSEALVYTSGSALARRRQGPGLLRVRAGAARRAAAWSWSIAASCRRTADPIPAATVDGAPSRSSACCAGRSRRLVRRRTTIAARESLVRARSPRRWRQRKGWGDGGAVLYRAGGAGAARRPAAARRRSRSSLRNDHLQYALTWYGLAAGAGGDVRDLGVRPADAVDAKGNREPVPDAFLVASRLQPPTQAEISPDFNRLGNSNESTA